MKRRSVSVFETYLRTGRRVTDPGPIEVKFNPWHDPEDGRFTFAGQGKHFGDRSSGRAPGARPAAKFRVPNAKPVATSSRASNKPVTATAPNSLERLARSFKPRPPGPGQNSATPLADPVASVERMRRESRSVRKPAAVSKELAQRFKRHMIDKEGYENVVYPDPVGRPTVGIGHLVVPEDRLKLGDRISNAQVETFWKQDSAEALRAAEQQMRDAGITDPAFFVALANVNFQLGNWWHKEHKKTWALILRGDYEAAAREVKDSKWFRQTPERVEAFRTALTALPEKQQRKKQ